MSLMRQVAGNTALLSAAQIVNPLTSVLLVSAIAHNTGADGLGTYALVLELFYLASSLGALGLMSPISRAVAKDHRRAVDYLGVSIALALGVGGLAALAMISFIYVMGYTPEVRHAGWIMTGAVIPSVLLVFLEAIFLGVGRAKQIAAIAIAENVAKVAAGSTLLYLERGIEDLFFAIVAVRFAAVAVYLTLFRSSISSLSPRFDMATALQLQQESVVFTGGALIGVIFGRVDILILSALAPIAVVGHYSAALRLVDIARLIPMSYMRAALPAMSSALPGSIAECRRLVRHSVAIMLLYGVLAAAGIFLVGGFVVDLIYGPDFGETKKLLHVLAPSLIPGALASVAATLLLAAHLERRDLAAQVVFNVMNLFLCVVLVPSLQGFGAAVAQLAGHVVFVITLGYMLRTAAASNESVREVMRMRPRPNLPTELP